MNDIWFQLNHRDQHTHNITPHAVCIIHPHHSSKVCVCVMASKLYLVSHAPVICLTNANCSPARYALIPQSCSTTKATYTTTAVNSIIIIPINRCNPLGCKVDNCRPINSGINTYSSDTYHYYLWLHIMVCTHKPYISSYHSCVCRFL